MRTQDKLAKDGMFTASRDDADNQPRLRKIDVYCKEAGELKFVPRAALVDLELRILDVIKASSIGTMSKVDNFVFGASGVSNNWAKGHSTECAQLIDQVVDVTRKDESCDCPQGLEIIIQIKLQQYLALINY